MCGSLRALPGDATLRGVAVADTIDVHALAVGLSHSRAESAARGCSNPIRLTGSSTTLDTATGEVVRTYASADEPDGHTYVRCGNRRASVCPSCPQEHKGDAWPIRMAGLPRGLGGPESERGHPSGFPTPRAPFSGPVPRAPRQPGRRASAAR